MSSVAPVKQPPQTTRQPQEYPPETHRRASIVARTLMKMQPKPVK